MLSRPCWAAWQGLLIGGLEFQLKGEERLPVPRLMGLSDAPAEHYCNADDTPYLTILRLPCLVPCFGDICLAWIVLRNF